MRILWTGKNLDYGAKFNGTWMTQLLNASDPIHRIQGAL